MKYLIYLITIIIIVYLQFVGTYMQKKADLKLVQEYLSIPVPVNTVNTANHFRIGDGSFVIWSDLNGTNKNIDFTKTKLEQNGWKLVKTENQTTNNVYYFEKNDLYYWVSDFLVTKNGWGECIGYKK